MKNLISIIVITIITVLFTGCGASNGNITTNNLTNEIIMNSFKIEDNGNNQYTASGYIKGLDNSKRIAPTKMIQIKKLSELGAKNGYKYFAIIDKVFNNVTGTPIVDIETLFNATYEHRHAIQLTYIGEDIETKVLFFKENPNLFPVWNIEKTNKTSLKSFNFWADENDRKNIDKYLDFYQY
jgi:hypothetical protein